jgi:capsular polysaccharide biosynthesis protein
MAKVVDLSLTIEPTTTDSHWMLGAKTMLLDRVVPHIERMFLPPAVSVGGIVTFHYDGGSHIAESRRTGLRAIKHRLTTKDRPGARIDTPFVDMRNDAPQNWSHALLFHIPMSHAARQALGTELTVLLPANIPSYVVAIFRTFGFPVVATDWAVEGRLCRVTTSNTDIVKNIVGDLIVDLVDQVHAIPPAPGDADLPEKIFVARKGTRAVTNQAEIEAILAPLGYVTVYPERFSPLDQIRMFDRAIDVVGVHGAALAPIAYRRRSRPPLKLVEILPAAHMTDFHRVILNGVGGKYVGVRGRITVGDAAAAYRFGEPYVANSLSNFEVDPDSLRLALEMIEQ